MNAKAKVEYRISGRKIYRGHQQIAKFTKKKKVKYLKDEYERYRLPVDALLKREGLIEGRKCGKGSKADHPDKLPPAPPTEPVDPAPPEPPLDDGAMTPSADDDDDEEIVTTPTPERERPQAHPPEKDVITSHGYSVAELERMLKEANGDKVVDYDRLMIELGMEPYEGEIPAMPAEGNEGDKTPAIVEWYRDYKPREFLERYKVEGRGMIKQYNAKSEYTGDLEMFMGKRKTHITAKTYSN